MTCGNDTIHRALFFTANQEAKGKTLCEKKKSTKTTTTTPPNLDNEGKTKLSAAKVWETSRTKKGVYLQKQKQKQKAEQQENSR